MNTSILPLADLEGHAYIPLLVDVIYYLALPQDMPKHTLPFFSNRTRRYLREVWHSNDADATAQENLITTSINGLQVSFFHLLPNV